MSEARLAVDPRSADTRSTEPAIADPPAGARFRPLLLLPALVFLALAALFAVRLGAGDPAKLPSALIGRPVPAFDLPPLPGVTARDGAALPGLAARDLAGPRPGGTGVTVVNVWASWCGPCQTEHPQLLALASRGVRLVGIDYKDKPEAARRFLTGLGNPFAAIGADASGRTGIEWGVYGVPETFVVGPDGRIRYKQVGPLTPDLMPAFLEEVRKAGAAGP